MDDERPPQGRMMVMQQDATPLRRELEALREANAVVQADIGAQAEGGLTIDDLNETERSAATIGVHPEALKPIGWMNSAHYHSLLTGNSLDGRLAQQIEAYKVVAGSD
jgi:hypothetical protein